MFGPETSLAVCAQGPAGQLVCWPRKGGAAGRGLPLVGAPASVAGAPRPGFWLVRAGEIAQRPRRGSSHPPDRAGFMGVEGRLVLSRGQHTQPCHRQDDQGILAVRP